VGNTPDGEDPKRQPVEVHRFGVHALPGRTVGMFYSFRIPALELPDKVRVF
jgi:hypothetical protein